MLQWGYLEEDCRMDDPINLTPEAVALWLKSLDRDTLHSDSWPEVNRRFHGLVRAARPYIQKHFSPDEQKAAFDGLTLALAIIARFEDIHELKKIFAAHLEEKITSKPTPKS